MASSSGALASVKCLIDLGAYVLRRDDNHNNVIHLAALRFHTNVLEFFIQWNHPDVPVWKILVGRYQDKCKRIRVSKIYLFTLQNIFYLHVLVTKSFSSHSLIEIGKNMFTARITNLQACYEMKILGNKIVL